MKCLLLILFACLNAPVVFAQPAKKSAQKEKAPTQAEMQKMMQEAQQMLNDMSPEDKKMMDSMGIKIDLNKAAKNVSGVSDAQLAKAWDDETRLTPRRDAARIAAISKTPLSAATMPSFIASTNGFVLQKLNNSAKALGEKIYNQLKTEGKSITAIGNTAVGLWMMGRVETALYVIAKASGADASNTDNLSNYASMLSMAGAEQLAIPILNNLNKQFPQNTTVLNNLGQAWFGLGEINVADKYLDSVIRIYAYHPQATYTKSFIEEEKGNTAKAVELVRKSIRQSYSQQKETRLNKMGYKLSSSDLDIPFKPDPDPLAMGMFKHPDFPGSAAQEIKAKQEWETYRHEIETMQGQLKQQMQQAQEVWSKKLMEIQQHDMNVVRASMAANKPVGDFISVPLYAQKGILKLKEIEKDGGLKYRWEEATKKVAMYPVEKDNLRKEYEQQIEKVREEDDEQTGEGKPNKDFCPKYADVVTQYLGAYNPGLQEVYDEYLKQYRLKLSEEVYWTQYVQWPEQFEVTKIGYKLAWLDALHEIRYGETHFFENRAFCSSTPSPTGGPLANFNDINCKYHSTLNLGFGSISNDCNMMTTKFEMGFLKLGLKQDMDKETFEDQFVSCNVEVSGKFGSSVKMGPVSAGIEAGAGVGVEIGRNGIEDVYITGKAGAGVGTNVIGAMEDAGTPASMGGIGVGDRSVDVGVEGRISLVSGRSSVEGTGILGK